MFKNWSRGAVRGEIGSSVIFLMHFRFSEISEVGDISGVFGIDF